MDSTHSTAATHHASARGRWMALVAALLGWMFDGFEIGMFPLVGRPALGELLVSSLAPINARFVELRSDRGALDAILHAGAAKARALAAPTLEAAYTALGLVRG